MVWITRLVKYAGLAISKVWQWAAANTMKATVAAVAAEVGASWLDRQTWAGAGAVASILKGSAWILGGGAIYGALKQEVWNPAAAAILPAVKRFRPAGPGSLLPGPTRGALFGWWQ